MHDFIARSSVISAISKFCISSSCPGGRTEWVMHGDMYILLCYDSISLQSNNIVSPQDSSLMWPCYPFDIWVAHTWLPSPEHATYLSSAAVGADPMPRSDVNCNAKNKRYSHSLESELAPYRTTNAPGPRMLLHIGLCPSNGISPGRRRKNSPKIYIIVHCCVLPQHEWQLPRSPPPI